MVAQPGREGRVVIHFSVITPLSASDPTPDVLAPGGGQAPAGGGRIPLMVPLAGVDLDGASRFTSFRGDGCCAPAGVNGAGGLWYARTAPAPSSSQVKGAAS